MGPSKCAVRMAFISDVHIPFQDDAALLDMLKVFRWWKPSLIVVMGDLVDAGAVSAHLQKRTPTPLQVEIDIARAFLAHLRDQFPGATIHYHWGNHEYRLERLIFSKAPGLASLRGLTWPELMDLDTLDIGWTEYKKPYYPFGQRGLFEVWHGFRASSAHPASVCVKMLKEAHVNSGVSAHTHRLQHVHHTSGGFTRSWLECGYMATDEVGADYAVRPSWQRGYGLGYRHEDGEVTLMGVRIVNGRSVLPGWI